MEEPLDGKPRLDAASLTRLYENYNRQYFAGRLPPVTIQVSEENDSDLQAEYDQASGSISFYLSDRTGDCILRTTLLHEMVHIAVPEDGHGARFRAELQRLAEAGDEDAEYEGWRMVNDQMWDDAWVGEESGRWERYLGATLDHPSADRDAPSL